MLLTSILVYGIGQPSFIDDDFYDFIATCRSKVQAIINLLTSIFGITHLFFPSFSDQLIDKHTLDPICAKARAIEVVESAGDKKCPFDSAEWIFLTYDCYLRLQPAANLPWTVALMPNLVTRSVVANTTLPYYAPDPRGTCWNRTWTGFAETEVFCAPLARHSHTLLLTIEEHR